MPDQSLMPYLTQAMSCLRTYALQLPSPPANFQIRPGATFSAMADSTRDECCEGVAWVRPGVSYETDDFPDPRSTAGRIEPAYTALQVELGIVRCIPTEGPEDGSVVTEAQWLAATQAAMNDLWALRKAVCCLRVAYGTDAVVVAQYTPLENEANCTGVSVLVTIRTPACDCTEDS